MTGLVSHGDLEPCLCVRGAHSLHIHKLLTYHKALLVGVDFAITRPAC